MKHRIALLMLSKLGSGDGGRETWLANFLDEIARQERPVSFEIIHQRSDNPNLLQLKTRQYLVAGTHVVHCRWPRCPVSVEFLLRLATGGFKVGAGIPLVAVGGLAEAIASLLVTPMRGKHGRVMWLRSIYTREKAAQLRGPLRQFALTFERLVLGRFGLILANGADTAEFYAGLGIKSEVIANAVPLHKWEMDIPRATEPLRVAFIGRLTDVKGIRQFLAAVELCEKAAPGRFRYHVAGDGPARDEVQTLSLRAPLTFHGQVDNDTARDIVLDSDVCVALTLSTPDLGGGGVSNALVEQMAAGRVLVAWDNDIFRQVLDPSVAYLVPQGDAKALANVMLQVLKNPDDALRRAEDARRRSKSYSIGSHVDRFFELVQKDTGALSIDESSQSAPQRDK